MYLGVVSDTHGQIAHTQAAVRMLESFELGQVIHCGDIGSAEIVPLFSPWPTHFVLGNVDYGRPDIPAAITAASQTCYGRFGSLELEGRRIAFLHGDDTRQLREVVRCGDWDLVCHGHTHVAKQEQVGDTLVLNPGAIFRANPHSIAVVDLPQLDVQLIPL